MSWAKLTVQQQTCRDLIYLPTLIKSIYFNEQRSLSSWSSRFNPYRYCFVNADVDIRNKPGPDVTITNANP